MLWVRILPSKSVSCERTLHKDLVQFDEPLIYSIVHTNRLYFTYQLHAVSLASYSSGNKPWLFYTICVSVSTFMCLYYVLVIKSSFSMWLCSLVARFTLLQAGSIKCFMGDYKPRTVYIYDNKLDFFLRAFEVFSGNLSLEKHSTRTRTSNSNWLLGNTFLWRLRCAVLKYFNWE